MCAVKVMKFRKTLSRAVCSGGTPPPPFLFFFLGGGGANVIHFLCKVLGQRSVQKEPF